MKIISKLINNLKYVFYIILYMLHKDRYILIQASLKTKNGRIKKFNWGDDFNLILVNKLANKKVLVLPTCWLLYKYPIEHYLVIGSIMTFFPLSKSIVWGSGIINDNEVDRIVGIPKDIISVRGPKTRNELLKLGIECPEEYGDPALLAPLLYMPKNRRMEYIGIIPHFIDLNSEVVIQILKNDSFKLIDVQNYNNWTDFIDEICSCICVISSSLHGLIISEAYNIPSIWGKFSEYPDGWDFKFLDFYESIGKNDTKSIKIDSMITKEEIVEISRTWKANNLDYKEMLEKCPFYDKNRVDEILYK